KAVELMKRLNVCKVIVGIESGDEKIRRMNGKPFSNQEILAAIKLLGKNKIKVTDCYVLGLMGETPESIKKTFDLSKKVDALCERDETGWSVILPLPGSPIWKAMMLKPELKEKYGESYEFNLQELREDYLNAFCHLNAESGEILESAGERI
ncbi:MAG: radical SAM protein, partial [Candidatus Diapherotrites archaeon]